MRGSDSENTVHSLKKVFLIQSRKYLLCFYLFIYLFVHLLCLKDVNIYSGLCDNVIAKDCILNSLP